MTVLIYRGNCANLAFRGPKFYWPICQNGTMPNWHKIRTLFFLRCMPLWHKAQKSSLSRSNYSIVQFCVQPALSASRTIGDMLRTILKSLASRARV